MIDSATTSAVTRSALYWTDYAGVADWPHADDHHRLHAAIDWLCRSMDARPDDGSCVSFKLLKGWSYSYPETTGYIIPTFYRYAAVYQRPDIAERATRMARWLASLQQADGALPGSDYRPGIVREPSVFNAAQMLIGLVAGYEATGDESLLSASDRAATWLASIQNDDGTWTKFAYRSGFSPSYYTRVCWPMLMTVAHSGNERVRAAAARGLDHIAAKLQPNGAIRDWGFAPDKPAFTHTIAYTIRGLMEAARLAPEYTHWAAAAEQASEKIFRIFEIRKRLAGAYDQNWKGTNWYICLTGNCQLAICWMRHFDATGDNRFVNAACKAIDIVSRYQPLRPKLYSALKGGIPGSAPVWGRYLTMRFPNWAAKFYAEALMMRDDRLQHIEQQTPGGV